MECDGEMEGEGQRLDTKGKNGQGTVEGEMERIIIFVIYHLIVKLNILSISIFSDLSGYFVLIDQYKFKEIITEIHRG